MPRNTPQEGQLLNLFPSREMAPYLYTFAGGSWRAAASLQLERPTFCTELKFGEHS